MPLRTLLIVALVAGLLLGVRVMFFGVKRVKEDHVTESAWQLALAVFLVLAGSVLYARLRMSDNLTVMPAILTLAASSVASLAVWRSVRRSAVLPSTDPDDDPRYRFQGHVARIVTAIGSGADGRIAFVADGQHYEFRAAWSAEADLTTISSGDNTEVVIERVDGDLAYVEPWAAVEKRL